MELLGAVSKDSETTDILCLCVSFDSVHQRKAPACITDYVVNTGGQNGRKAFPDKMAFKQDSKYKRHFHVSVMTQEQRLGT